jgi:uncharacterized protein
VNTVVTGLSEAETAALRSVFAPYGEVAAVWLFGSRARGDADADSDLDLAVDPWPGQDARRHRLDMLADLVERGFENVDLVFLDGDDPVLRFEALRELAVVMAAPGYDPAAAFLRSWRDHEDTAKWRAMSRDALLDAILERA